MSTPSLDDLKVGDRVRVIEWYVDPTKLMRSISNDDGLIRDAWTDEVLTADDNVTVPPGTEGTVDFVGVNPHVQWDNGRSLALLGRDRWERA